MSKHPHIVGFRVALTDLFRQFELDALTETGYGIGTLIIGDVPMHVVALRTEVRDETDGFAVEYIGVTDGGDRDLDAILALMGDGSGPPSLVEYGGHNYLIGIMPYGN